MSAAAISVPEFKQKPKKLPLPVKLGVGAVAGAFGTSCIFPIDTVKTRLQSAPSGVNPFTVMKNIMKAEGVAGYYNGLAANLIGVIPEKAIKLAANEMFREYLENEDGSISVFNEILAGGGAGICQVVATNPMEITKIRMQMQATLPLAERQSTVQVVQTLGIRGMYQGTAATLTRDVPFSVLFFPSYANLKKAFADHRGENSTFSLLAAGGIAGALAAAVVTPTDVVKTRLQVAGGKERYGNMANAARTILKEEGIGALYKGTVPRMVVVAPLFGITLLSFEFMKSYMIKHKML